MKPVYNDGITVYERANMEQGIKLTGLWKNKGRDGKTFLSGRLNGSSSLIVFPNNFKKGEKDPDYIVYLKPNEEKREAPKPAQAQGNDEL